MESKIDIKNDFTDYIKIFLEENSKHNLISRNDEKFLYEKHIYDSLGINLFFKKYGNNFSSILDIGCGGGFPCVPIALEYPNLKITGIDSIRKKIQSVTTIKEALNIDNLELICDRVENLHNKKFDLIVSRAVADLAKLSEYAIPLLKESGYFVAYKSKKAEEELSLANPIINSLNSKVVDIINYVLPTEEHHSRNLICIKKM